MSDNGRHPCRSADLIVKHAENCLLFLDILFENLLSEGFARYGRNCEFRLDHSLAENRFLDLQSLLESRNIGPNGDELSLAANGDASWVNEEVEFVFAEKGHPVKPLNICCSTSGPNGPRGKTGWREGHAATA